MNDLYYYIFICSLFPFLSSSMPLLALFDLFSPLSVGSRSKPPVSRRRPIHALASLHAHTPSTHPATPPVRACECDRPPSAHSLPVCAMSALSSGVDTEFPDAVAATLTRSNQSKQLTTRLNNAGTLLAVGCSDGAIVIYDFETRAVAKLLKGHTKPVIAVRSERQTTDDAERTTTRQRRLTQMQTSNRPQPNVSLFSRSLLSFLLLCCSAGVATRTIC